MNPFDPPGVPDDLPRAKPERELDVVTSRLLYTSEHLLETLARYRSQRLLFNVMRWMCILGGMVCFLGSIVALLNADFAICIGAAAFAVFLFFARKLDDLIALRSFRHSPHRDTQLVLEFTSEGLHSSSENHDSTIKWSAFSEATLFDDGVLLYQGPKLVQWIPDESLEYSGDAEELRRLVESNLRIRG
ncbi:MAG: YcxB family protein [Planctomycetota bacterium]